MSIGGGSQALDYNYHYRWDLRKRQKNESLLRMAVPRRFLVSSNKLSSMHFLKKAGHQASNPSCGLLFLIC